MLAAHTVDDRIVEDANRLADDDGAEAIVICGAALAGAGRRLQPLVRRRSSMASRPRRKRPCQTWDGPERATCRGRSSLTSGPPVVYLFHWLLPANSGGKDWPRRRHMPVESGQRFRAMFRHHAELVTGRSSARLLAIADDRVERLARGHPAPLPAHGTDWPSDAHRPHPRPEALAASDRGAFPGAMAPADLDEPARRQPVRRSRAGRSSHAGDDGAVPDAGPLCCCERARPAFSTPARLSDPASTQ